MKTALTDFISFEKFYREKKVFKDALAHEFAHVSDSVCFHPYYSPNSTAFSRGCSRCGIPHPRKGHDEVWHDKYDEFKSKIT